MTTFDDRERAEEAKFAHDEEMMFRIHARRNRLLGQWAAERMGLSAAEIAELLASMDAVREIPHCRRNRPRRARQSRRRRSA